MDRRLARAALGLIPVMALVFLALTRILPPVTGYWLGLSLYWGLLILALRRWRGWSLRPRAPGLAALVLLLPVLVLAACDGLPALPRLSPHVLVLVILGAAINGALEEAFWRGALVPRLAGWRDSLAPGLLFVLWHLAPLSGALSLMPATEAVLRLVGGAALLALPMIAARLSGGTAGSGALGHALVNVLAFAAVAAHPPPG